VTPSSLNWSTTLTSLPSISIASGALIRCECCDEHEEGFVPIYIETIEGAPISEWLELLFEFIN